MSISNDNGHDNNDPALKALDEKLKKVRGEDEASIQKREAENLDTQAKQGIQAGVELVAAIFIPTAIGYGLDNWLGTKPLFILVLFFLGICTGFYNVYRISQNMGTAVGNKPVNKSSDTDSDTRADKDA
ncbi:MAG: AtpZ/AtpI family protein [Alphaproteobacteria bacterium]